MFVQQLLALKHHSMRHALSYWRAQYLKHSHCLVALDYSNQLYDFVSLDQHQRIYHIPAIPVLSILFLSNLTSQGSVTTIGEEDNEKKQQQRRENGIRLNQLAQQRRQEKVINLPTF